MPKKDASTIPEPEIDRKYSMDDLKIGAQLQIGAATLPLRNILNIKVGEVISLDRPLAGPVQVLAGGRMIASGDLVLLDGCFAVSITEVSTMEMHLPAEPSTY